MRRLLCMLTVTAMLLGLTVFASAEDAALSKNTVILYTNDVHTYIDGVLSYDVLGAVKAELESRYESVLLVDAGDHVQGTAYGSMDKGKSVIELMNAAGYDLATPGNHEFDYGMDGWLNAVEWASFPYVSCNFRHEKDGVVGETVLDSYKIFECGERRIAIVGITTPETFTKTTPAYFQDGEGDFIYAISGGRDGEALYADVQRAVDEARDAGADTVIALGHLGIDPSSLPWTSECTVKAVSGLDAFIDGHSHSTVEMEVLADKDGNEVVLTQTGEYFSRIGMMVIDSVTGEIETDLIEVSHILSDDKETVEGYRLTSELYGDGELVADEAVKDAKDAWISAVDGELGKSIGSTRIVFDNYDADGNRIVRAQETNTGDLCSDALYYLFDSMDMNVDVAIMNGGGIRNNALTGDISYKTCKDVHPFGNVACLQTVTGRQLLDALEWGARNVGVEYSGSFLQVSGLTYTVNTTVPNTTKENDMEIWQGGPDEYRVRDVRIYNKETGTWDELDLEAEYDLAGYNYTLRDLGDGFAMFEGAVNVLDYVMEDYMVLANYVQAFEGDVDASNSPLLLKYPGFAVDYGTINGSGRITVLTKQESAPETDGADETDGGEDSNVPPASPSTGDRALLLLIPLVIGAVAAASAKKRSSDRLV